MIMRAFPLLFGVAFAQVVNAQSSVTLFGTVDVNLQSARSTGLPTQNTVGTQGNGPNRLGFKGTEDLGGGLKANFLLELGYFPDTGQARGGTASFFNRGANVGLSGGFGTLTLGRNWTTSYNSNWIYDPTYDLGAAASTNLASNGGQPSFYLLNNAVTYTLPGGLGGAYGEVQYAPSEGSVNGKYVGARIGYGSGPFDASVAMGRQDVAGGKYKTTYIGAAYDLGAVKLVGLYANEKVISVTEKRWLLGATVPIGSNYAFLSYQDRSLTAADASQIGLGYVHTLSKRTALYATFSNIDTDNAGKTRTVQAGLRHHF